MKEYEYICAGIEHFLVDELVAVICQENLDGKTYEHGFRKLFDNYKKLRRSFIELSYDGREIDSGDISNELAKKRNDVLNSFIDDIDAKGIYLEGYNHFDGYHNIESVPELIELVDGLI